VALDSIPTKTLGIEGDIVDSGCLRLFGHALAAVAIVASGILVALL
jgi:phage tail protein X